MPLICRCSEYVKGSWSYIQRLIKFCRRPENGSRTGNRKYFANDRTFIRDHISLDKVPKCYMCWPHTSKSRLCKFKNARFASYGKKYSKYTKGSLFTPVKQLTTLKSSAFLQRMALQSVMRKTGQVSGDRTKSEPWFWFLFSTSLFYKRALDDNIESSFMSETKQRGLPRNRIRKFDIHTSVIA